RGIPGPPWYESPAQQRKRTPWFTRLLPHHPNLLRRSNVPARFPLRLVFEPEMIAQIALFGRKPVPSAHAESVYDTKSTRHPFRCYTSRKTSQLESSGGWFSGHRDHVQSQRFLCLLWFGLLIRAGLAGGEWASASGAERCWTAPSE